ncbi:transcription termination factor NusA [Patescibacteria group bacterium]|nr:transcription termination factor NusA [Patescibacteria group bacterium]
MDLKQLVSAVEQISAEKGISSEKVLGAIESAIAAAYKKEYRKKSEIIRAKFNLKTGDLQFFQVKTVVDPSEVSLEEDLEETPERNEEEETLPRFNSDRQIFVAEAKKISPDISVGEEMEFPLEGRSDFGRIAAQTAKQVVLQSIREAERSSIKEEFINKEGEIMSGQIQRFERGNVYVNLGRAMGIMYPNESIPGEHYRVGDRMRFYVLAVQDDMRRPGIVLSRSHPNFILKLFELEVPEIADGTVSIKNIAREAGSRTKVAVASSEEGIDPVGAAVGQRGTRVMAVTNELGNEKVDVVEWSDDPAKFIPSSLSPAKVKSIEIMPRREAKVLVPEDQLSLAIGKGGQNVRLAAKLTGWKIDVRSQSNPEEVQEGGIAAAEAKDVPSDDGDDYEEVNKVD